MSPEYHDNVVKIKKEVKSSCPWNYAVRAAGEESVFAFITLEDPSHLESLKLWVFDFGQYQSLQEIDLDALAPNFQGEAAINFIDDNLFIHW